jgi:hypothetical protein
VHALELGVDAGDRQRPARVVTDRGDCAAQAPLELVLENAKEELGAAAEPVHPGWDPRRLAADGDRDGAAGLRHEEKRVAPGEPSEWPELVAADQHGLGADPARPELGEDPMRGVGLVGEPDLDVLCVARHLRSFETCLTCGGLGKLDGLPQTGQAGGVQPQLDGGQERVDPRLGRIVPLGLRYQVDLAAVQALGDDLGPQAASGEGGNGCLGRPRERGILFGRRFAAMDEADAPLTDPEGLGAPIQAEVEPTGPARSRAELPVDVVDVRAAHDHDLHAGGAQPLDNVFHGGRIGRPVGNGRSVPVEDDRLEAPVDDAREILSSAHGRQPLSRRFAHARILGAKRVRGIGGTADRRSVRSPMPRARSGATIATR